MPSCGAELGGALEARQERVEVDLLERTEHPPGRPVRERDDAVPVDDDDALADRADDRVELRRPRPLRPNQLGKASLVGEALAERGCEAGPLPVALVLRLLPAGDVVEGVDRVLDAAGPVAQGDRADDRPALLAGGPDPEPDRQVARWLATQDAGARECACVERAPVLVQQLEPGADRPLARRSRARPPSRSRRPRPPRRSRRRSARRLPGP